MQQGRMPSGNHGGSQSRRFFDKVLRDENANFDARKDGPKFITAMLEFKDAIDLLFRMTSSQGHGIARLRRALINSDDPVFVKHQVVPLLQKLGSDQLFIGTCKAPLQQLLTAMHQVPGFIDSLRAAIVAGTVTDGAAIGWFVLYVANCSEAARSDPAVQQLVEPLENLGGAGAHAAAQLKGVLGMAGAASTDSPMIALEDLEAQVGGRHDNDKQNFKDIRIVPTADEALCSKAPYLPKATDPNSPQTLTPEMDLLDRTFRMMREDFMGPLRKELSDLGITQQQQQAGQEESGPSSSNKPAKPKWQSQTSRNVYQTVLVLGVCVHRRPCVMVSLQLPPGHRALKLRTKREKEDFWEHYGSGTLPIDALVCLVVPDSPLLFASVVRREVGELSLERPMIGLSFESEEGQAQALMFMGQQDQAAGGLSLIQVSTQLLSIRPVLRCMQDMTTIPFAEEIVKGVKEPSMAGYLSEDVIAEEMGNLGPSWDVSQRHGLQQALVQRVAIVQGPPGTGKTYTAVQLLDIVLRRSKEKVMVVCYTNHALDQVLEHILARNVLQPHELVRLGSRSKTPGLEKYTMYEQVGTRPPLSQAEYRRSKDIQGQLSTAENEVKRLSMLLMQVQQFGVMQRNNNVWKKREKEMEEEDKRWKRRKDAKRGVVPEDDDEDDPPAAEVVINDWDYLSPYLEFELPEVHKQLHRPAPQQNLTKQIKHPFRGNRPRRPQPLWRNWIRGLAKERPPENNAGAGSAGDNWHVKSSKRPRREPPASQQSDQPAEAAAPSDPLADIWALHVQVRRQYAARWREGLRAQWSEQLSEQLQLMAKLLEEKRELQQSSWEAVLEKVRVIGCTTTGAANFKSVLQGRNAATVVLVEEGAEILEAHVLTSLTSRAKHLIMIGDHKQLRPKNDNYALSAEANNGYNLNISLFERMVEGGYPYASLSVQHRMHPELSKLVRPTYPLLEDHPAVSTRGEVKGLTTRLAFIDHDRMEKGEGEASQKVKWGLVMDTQSKVNEHEVGMVVAVVRYLLQQGYSAEDLVVLTFYLGQLQEINGELRRQKLEVTLGELDKADLQKQGMGEDNTDTPNSTPNNTPTTTTSKSAAPAAQAKKASKATTNGVRVSTVDNFQGEEKKIVIISCVRSNAKGDIGFLRAPQRINVAVSRARDGMIIIGNATCLRNARNPDGRRHWSALLAHFEAAGLIFNGLPAVCQQHKRPIEPSLLSSPEAFAQHVPDGGCCLPCGATMPCGHMCPLRCHAYDAGHERVKCEEQVYSYCDKGHLTVRKCCDRDTVCGTCAEIERLKRRQKMDMEQLEREAAQKRAKADIAEARSQTNLERLKRQLAASEEAREAQKRHLELELQEKKLKLQVELQEKHSRVEMAAAEVEARERAERELAELEASFNAEAEARRIQAQNEAAAVQQRFEKSILKVQREMEVQRKQADRELQQLANKRTRADVRLQDAEARVDGNGRAQMAEAMSVHRWKEAVAQLAIGTPTEVDRFKSRLQQSREAGASGLDADTLDLVFETPGLGAVLLAHAGGQAPAQPPPPPSWEVRAQSLLKEAKWFEAMKYFDALATDTTTQTTNTDPLNQSINPAIQAYTTLCQIKLNLPHTAVTPATSVSGSHPVQHLCYALPPPLPPGPSDSPTNRLRLREAHAKAVGQAVAYLLHPDAGALPGVFREEALKVLTACARSIAPGNVMPLGASSSSRGTPASQQSRFAERAKGSAVLMKLVDMVGLQAVKEQLLALKDQVALDKERGRDITKQNYNVQFYGNPGTGKTVVARIYAELLAELGVLKQSAVEECNGAELANEGVDKLKKRLEKLDKGGVLFIDEAYQINPDKSSMGRQIMDYLLPEMENKRGRLVVVMAGYQKHMEDLMAFNEGLPSRFPNIYNFADYLDDQLTQIFMGMLKKDNPKFTLQDEKHVRIAARRLGRQRGKVGFGNARAVRNLMEKAITRQSDRLLRERGQGRDPDVYLLAREDLLGPRQLDLSNNKALQELEGMRGLERVKQSVKNLLQLISTNAELEDQERPLKDLNLNRVFLGNPGTGKTTVAGVYGSILRDLGLLSKGEVVVKVPADFVGTVLGESEKKTAAILEASVGCVLVIDEAYGLHAAKGNDPYREAVIDTIVAKVQGVPGDDRCVLLLGYKDQMEEMLRKANPGLARRFQMQAAWYFDDYKNDDLSHIMQAAARKKYGWELGWAELQAGVEVLDKERRKPNFGNAGAVNNLLSQVAQRMEQRLTSQGLTALQRAAAVPTAEDFNPEGGRQVAAADVFADLVGCKEVLDKLRVIQATITASQRLGKDPLESIELNFRFVGAPGTGKTTVAKRVGMLFESLGLLSGSEVVACSASDFVTGYANQASGKTREMFQRAAGQVLFIDEAYRLNPKIGGPFMQEVLDEIVQLLTEDTYRGKMVVILAGYEHQIEELMTVNPGLKSRFSEKLYFPDFSCKDACKLMRIQLSKDCLNLSAEAEEHLPNLMQQLIDAPGWSNGRDVVTWSKRIFQEYALQSTASQGGGGEAQGALSVRVLQRSLDSLLDSKAAPPPTSLPPAAPPSLLSLLPQLPIATQSAPEQPRTATASAPPVVAVQMESHPLQQEEEAARDEETAPVGADAASSAGFKQFSSAFLASVQSGLEALGYDLTSADIMMQLAGNSNLPNDLLPELQSAALATGVTDAEVLREMVRQWQMALQKQMELEMEMRKRKKRPVWKCAVCGRYGCPVSPYIESYQEVDE